MKPTMAIIGMMNPIQSSMLPLGAVLTACRIRGKINTIIPAMSTTLPIVIQSIINLYIFIALKQHAPDIPGREAHT